MELLNKAWETPPTEKKRECGTVIGIAYLALVSFTVPLAFGIGMLVPFPVEFETPFDSQSIWGILLCLAAIACIWPVSAYRMRNANVVRCTVIVSIALGWAVLFALMFRYRPFFSSIDLRFSVRILLFPILFAIPILLSLFVAEFAASRTKAFYSDASGSWLQSYSVARGFAFDEEAIPFEDLTVEDIMRAESVPVKHNGRLCRLMLYLDRVPDGNHILALEWREEYRFLSLLSPRTDLKKKRFAITRQQAEQIAERFGPVKKTFFLDLRHNNGNTP